jgi:hypothetical protein
MNPDRSMMLPGALACATGALGDIAVAAAGLDRRINCGADA